MTKQRYDDGGHPPNAIHEGESPRTMFHRGPYDIRVSLETWGPQERLMETLYQAVTQTWGDAPTKIDVMTENQARYLEKLFRGNTLGQSLEGVNFYFQIEGISRACTHQVVRTRIGAGFMQHGGRDNDWRMRPFNVPETVWRAMNPEETCAAGLDGCIKDWGALERYSEFNAAVAEAAGDSEVEWSADDDLQTRIARVVTECKGLYAALVDAGIPFQDARRFLPIGLTTHLVGLYNYVALRGVLSNRLEHIMDWEINCVAQLMQREVRMKCPGMIAADLVSHSDRAGEAKFAGMNLWVPDQKYPYPYNPDDYVHTARQNPFWVLTETAMAGGDIEWIPTNGIHPNADSDGIIRGDR